jgi:hypothetical protein
MLRSRRTLVALVLVAVVGLAGCGSKDDAPARSGLVVTTTTTIAG